MTIGTAFRRSPAADAVTADTVPGVAGPSRRTVLRGLAALTTVGVAASVVGRAPAAQAAPATPAATTAAGTTAKRTTDTGVHLLKRATFGLNPTVRADHARLGAAGWLDAQLSPSTLADPVDDMIARQLPRLAWTTAQVRSAYSAPTGAVVEDMLAATAARAVWSTRQLQEVMVDLWSNHLNVPATNGDLWATRHAYDGVIRANALGSFSALLTAAVTHPAMLQYLNADRSTGSQLNENLGRELLELHTVGIDAGYSQAEVVDSARILTGLGQAADGTTRFRAADHYVGRVSVLGFTHANRQGNGLPVVKAYLAYLATHPATARRIATKLAVRFVSDTPPSSLVDTLTKVYLDNGSQIAPVLRALFTSDEFAAAVGGKTRRPYEDVWATARVCDVAPGAVDAQAWATLVQLTRLIGQQPLGYATPDGYSDLGADFASAAFQLGRFNLHQTLPWGSVSVFPTPAAYTSGTLTTMGAAVDAVAARFLGTTLSATHRKAVLTFLGRAETYDVRSWTWRQVEWLVVPLLLDSPYFTNR